LTVINEKPSVVLYTTHCPKCVILQERLCSNGIKHDVVVDVAVMKEKGMLTAPMLEVDGKLLTFLGAVEWLRGVENADTN